MTIAQFGLELNQEKTRLIAFGRFAWDRIARLGRKKPETFDFLGFTHICVVRVDNRASAEGKVGMSF